MPIRYDRLPAEGESAHRADVYNPRLPMPPGPVVKESVNLTTTSGAKARRAADRAAPRSF